MEKIVTLIPSATEIVVFLGKKNLIVGRSHECDYPKDLNKIKKLTSPKINIDSKVVNIGDAKVSDTVVANGK